MLALRPLPYVEGGFFHVNNLKMKSGHAVIRTLTCEFWTDYITYEMSHELVSSHFYK